MPSAPEELTFTAYAGDGCTLLAFDFDADQRQNLAGFAVWCTAPGGLAHPIYNRLSFAGGVTSSTTPQEQADLWTPTDRAPLQRFHWVHFPYTVVPGAYTYRATAMLYGTPDGSQLIEGPTQELTVELIPPNEAHFTLGFTRGYVSSQAYASRFHNAPLAPDPQTISFDTTPYEARYSYLGYDARRMLFAFLDEAIADPDATLDVFAYDLDEPDVISRLEQLGGRMRLFLDNAELHTRQHTDGTYPREVDALAVLETSAGAANVKTGHFARFSHSKVLILKRGGLAVKVLAGSANFSVRGLYVQSNNVFVFDDPGAAGFYETAFNQAWDHPMTQFDDSPIAAGWNAIAADGVPACEVSFSPHTDADISLDKVADAIRDATSTVLFAVMDIGDSSGPVADELERLKDRPELYAAGTTQSLTGALKTTTPADPNSPYVPFGYLKDNVPEPFHAEFGGGRGQVIHHKFVVCDFNGATPVAFAGSSNLAGGGEVENGDNLVAFSDRQVATRFAVEAIRLIDHYRFRSAQYTATENDPLMLQPQGADWTSSFYDPTSARFAERRVMAGTA